jgi:hypothetical protein
VVAETPPIQSSPPAWEAGGPITGSSSFLWGTFVQPRGLAPGASVTGFRLASSALPTVVAFMAWGDAEPPPLPPGQEPAESCANSDATENSFKGKTIGPKTPPEPFVTIDFLNYLIALLHDTRRQGWITRDSIHLSMLSKLREAKRRLEANDPAGANNTVKAFLGEVAGASCEDFNCRGNLPASTEAYALLYFNGKYLSDRLP